MSLHHLSDERVHYTWSGNHCPVLTIESGDEIAFRTRDGFDGQLDGLSPSALEASLGALDFTRIAPLSGPVRVAGARPGDAVRIEVMELQPSGPGWTVVWPAWAGFDYHRPPGVASGGRIRSFSAEDLRAGGAVRIGRAQVPLCPMLGMIGVAPAFGDFPTLPPREFGGNLDLRLLGAGVALRLPVLTEGALVSLGDGHAVQGDGELCTTAVECGMAGRVRITVEPGGAPQQAEVETPEAWITTGFGRTLDLAVQAAVNGMHAKLVRAGMDATDAYMLLSVAAHVGVNQVVNMPHVGARVTLSKEVLR